jgi:Na+/proline symporter
MPVTGENSDSYMPQLARTMLPLPLYVVFLGALISAILSTIDSTLLSISGLIGRNIVEPLRPDLSEKAKLRLQRGLTLAAAVVVYFVATGGDSIYALIQTTSSFGAAGILVVMLAGLWTPRGGPRTGFCTVLAGIVFTVFAQLVFELDAAFLISLAGCVAVYIAGAWFERTTRGTLSPKSSEQRACRETR